MRWNFKNLRNWSMEKVFIIEVFFFCVLELIFFVVNLNNIFYFYIEFLKVFFLIYILVFISKNI